ncbi:site-specific integrase [Anaerobacillus alkaliphilus]|uniref:Site-specific integrase n=1 Tax=Anaerobacillus alkaliphilus TaxID=1548597 RepID=A0A4Q0VMX7_9BACI|nr:tyrosine-type recombinase/integrase [Anaerobacillus alkaliphilus]RXI95558.1 site-specific integrase [Anaerobacillus alkaliphilus]
MEFVEAIKSREKINEIKDILFKRSKRDFLLFTLGINTGLKISDILKIKKEQIIDTTGNFTEFLILENEVNYSYLNKQVINALQVYLATVPSLTSEDYLFRSKKGEHPITRQQAYRIINSVAKEVGIESKIGTHTLRKTFGYHAYRGGVAVSLLQKIFHHSSRGETLRYIGIEQKDMHARIDVNL